MRKLLEAMTKFAGQPEQKPGEQWKGTDKGTPGNKLVGSADESVLKDLSKGKTPKTKEQELAEEWANFNEDDLGVEEKRPHRTGSRADKVGVRGHKEQPRYTTIKSVDEANDEPVDWGNLTKREFKNKEMEHELGHEDKQSNRGRAPGARTPKMIGMYFYNINTPDKERSALAMGVKKTKSGKWAIAQYDTSGATFHFQKNSADAFFGPGKWWAPKQIDEGERADKYKAAMASLDRLSSMAQLNTEIRRLEQLVKEKEKEQRKQPSKEINEYGADAISEPAVKPGTSTGATTGTTAPGTAPGAHSAIPVADPLQAKNIAAATATIKSATHAAAAPDKLAQTLSKANTGQALNPGDMQVLKPVMGVIGQTAQDPKLANQFKTLAAQAKAAQARA